MLDKKKLKKLLVILVLIAIIVVAIILIRNTLARYESDATSSKDVDAAFWIVNNTFESNQVVIKDIYPADTTYDYSFTVSNFEGNKKAETDLTYDLVLKMTTNLPLEYDVQKNGKACKKTEELIQDEDGTYYRQIKLDTDANGLKMKQGTDQTSGNSGIFFRSSRPQLLHTATCPQTRTIMMGISVESASSSSLCG